MGPNARLHQPASPTCPHSLARGSCWLAIEAGRSGMEGAQYISPLGRVFAITLHADKANPSRPASALLEELAQELRRRAVRRRRLNSENLERVLWARLSLLPTGYP
eukprot:jgi/Tetstr1/458128/TSEL_044620.t1